MKNSIIGVGIIALLLVLGAIGFISKDAPEPIVEDPVVQEQGTESTGSVTGPDSYSTYNTFNGARYEWRSQKFARGTTSVCSLQSPTYATSTLISDGVVRTGTSTDYTLTLAKSLTSRQATTTNIRTETVTADGIVLFPTASTTYNAVADATRTFPPGTYFNVGIAGLGNPASSTLDGFCSAVFTTGS